MSPDGVAMLCVRRKQYLVSGVVRGTRVCGKKRIGAPRVTGATDAHLDARAAHAV